MSIRRLWSGVLMIVLVGAAAVFPLPAAYAQSPASFVSAASTCQEAIFSFEFNVQTQAVSGAADAFIFAIVTAEDSEGTLLGEQGFAYVGYYGVYDGLISYSQQPVGDVTLTLWLSRAGSSALDARQIDGYFAVDAVTVPAQCEAGCDTLVAIPSQAVMGQFIADAPLYWAPGQLVVPGLTIQAGKTYLVIGQDASGQYRKILLQCQFLWVPFGSVGPNPDAVWNNTPLPTTVVK